MASHQPEVGFSPVLSLRTSPGLIAAREFLQLPSIAVEAAVESELGSNPALERVESGECPLCTPGWSAACPLCLPKGSMGAARLIQLHPQSGPLQIGRDPPRRLVPDRRPPDPHRSGRGSARSRTRFPAWLPSARWLNPDPASELASQA